MNSVQRFLTVIVQGTLTPAEETSVSDRDAEAFMIFFWNIGYEGLQLLSSCKLFPSMGFPDEIPFFGVLHAIRYPVSKEVVEEHPDKPLSCIRRTNMNCK